MHLSSAGLIAEEEWVRTGRVRSDVQLDAFVVMPDHFHAIIRVEAPAKTPRPCRGPAARSLDAIMKQYKSQVARRIEAACGISAYDVWQRGFHEWVIRDPRHLNACRSYVANNPLRWNEKGPTTGRPCAEISR